MAGQNSHLLDDCFTFPKETPLTPSSLRTGIARSRPRLFFAVDLVAGLERIPHGRIAGHAATLADVNAKGKVGLEAAAPAPAHSDAKLSHSGVSPEIGQAVQTFSVDARFRLAGKLVPPRRSRVHVHQRRKFSFVARADRAERRIEGARPNPFVGAGGEGKNYVMGEEVDDFIVILSAVGIATTAAPYGDWLPATLKVARRLGVLTKTFVETFATICRVALKTKDFKKVRAFGDALWTLAKNSSSTQALRLLRYVDDSADAARLASFMSKHPKNGAFILHALDDDIVKHMAKGTVDPTIAIAGFNDALILTAARKGPAGSAMLKKNTYWLRPHPTIGLVRGAVKQNLQRVLVKSHKWLGIDIVPVIMLIISLYMLLQLFRLRREWRRNPC